MRMWVWYVFILPINAKIRSESREFSGCAAYPMLRHDATWICSVVGHPRLILIRLNVHTFDFVLAGCMLQRCCLLQGFGSPAVGPSFFACLLLISWCRSPIESKKNSFPMHLQRYSSPNCQSSQVPLCPAPWPQLCTPCL